MAAFSERPPPLTATIAQLFIYPVKSLRGVAVRECLAGACGLEGDRRWMIVRADGRFVTQRELPRLATIDATLDEDALCLAAPGAGTLRLPLVTQESPVIQTAVWADHCEVIDCGPQASDWLQTALAPPWRLRLVRMRPGFVRALAHEPELGAGSTTVFADGGPLLVVNRASLDALNDALGRSGRAPVGIDRFRGNIVLEGLPAFAEHDYDTLQAEAGSIGLCYPCVRCVVTTIDQRSGVRDRATNEPYRTLSVLNTTPGRPDKPVFGVNAVWRASATRLRVGDIFTALRETDSKLSGGYNR